MDPKFFQIFLKINLKEIYLNMQINSFVKSVLNVSFFTILAQIVGIIALPIITRFYSPYDFGLYSFFVTIISILGIFATAKYDNAILVADNLKIRKQLILIIFLLSIFIALSFTIILIILNLSGIYSFNINSQIEFMILIFLSIIFYSNSLSLNYWHNTHGRYTLMGSAGLLRSISAAAIKILIVIHIAFLGFGLIYGFVLSQGLFLLMLLFAYFLSDYRRKESLTKKINSIYSYQELKKVLIKYKDFPKFALPTDFLSTISLQAPILLTGPIFGGATLGYFALARTVLGLPTQVLGGSVRSVFQKEAALQFNKKGSCEEIFKKTFFSMTGIVLIPCIITILYAEPIFVIIFGEEWKLAGTFCQILAPLYFIRMIAKPLNFMFQLTNHLKFDLKLMNMFVVFSFVSFSIGAYLDSAKVAFILISVLHSLAYIIYLWFSYLFSTGYKINERK